MSRNTVHLQYASISLFLQQPRHQSVKNVQLQAKQYRVGFLASETTLQCGRIQKDTVRIRSVKLLVFPLSRLQIRRESQWASNRLPFTLRALLPPVFFCLVPAGPVRSLVSLWWIICRVQNTQIRRTSLCSHVVTVPLLVCPILLMGYEYGLTHRWPSK